MNREVHVRFCEGLGVQFPGPTRHWREELLFLLSQHVELYRIYQEKISDCDLQLRKHLESLSSKRDLKTQPIGPKPKGKKGSRNAPQFDLRTELYRISHYWHRLDTNQRHRCS